MKISNPMKIIYIIVFSLLLFGCKERKEQEFISPKMPLRQLVNGKQISTETNGSFFLVSGSFSNQETEEYKVKMFVKIEESYRLLDIPLTEIRIQIDNSVSQPYAYIKYEDYEIEPDLGRLIETMKWKERHLTIVCPESVLPEKLLPISL